MNKNLVKLFLVLVIVLILLIIGYFIIRNYITFDVKKIGDNDDSIIDYANRIENIQSYGTSKGSLNETLGENGSMQEYKDLNGDIAYIPKNFKLSDKKDEQTINTGLVVIRTRWK